MAIATEEYGANFFANRATLSGILEYHGYANCYKNVYVPQAKGETPKPTGH